MSKYHTYTLAIKWTGNKNLGTLNYSAYERSHVVKINQKADILCSSDPSFRGDKSKHNPEELFLASISSCHMLWYLHLCAEAGVVVVDYEDNPTGIMIENDNGSGKFTEVVLQPIVTVNDKSMIELANELHHKANENCFIANSCNFPISHKPTCLVK